MRKLAAVLLVACRSAAPPPPPPFTLVELAQVEAARRADDPRLLGRARAGDVLAIRALGRIGGEQAVAILVGLLPADGVVEALWLAADDKTAPAVAKEYPRHKLAAARALGKLGSVAELPVLVTALGDVDPSVRAAAGRALGVAARRKIPYSKEIRSALARAAADPEPAVRFGAAYALAYENSPEGNEDVLLELAADKDAQTRALAVRGLGARGRVREKALDDADAGVRVEAVRAFLGKKSTADDHKRVGAWAVEEWTSIGSNEGRLQSDRVLPVIEAVTHLREFAKETAVAEALAKLVELTEVAGSTEAARYTPDMLRSIDQVSCQAAAGLTLDKLAHCGEASGKGWPLWARKQLLAGAAKDIAVLADLWKDEDPRVRMEVASAAGALLPDEGAVRILREALAGGPAVLGSAAEAIGAHCDKAGALLDALRAKAEAPDPEVRQSAAEALTACKLPAPAPAPKRPPPVDPAHHATGVTVVTSKGSFHVRLFPDVAPWNVATMTALAEKGFYDGTIWHRVVPGFVVQGGDPTGTGWGGPGFEVPAEASSLPYLRGTVGIADAGKDTGSSQWFVTLSPQPHLEGRYTIVGEVDAQDMGVVDKLLVGDAIDRVTVDASK